VTVYINSNELEEMTTTMIFTKLCTFVSNWLLLSISVYLRKWRQQ